MAQKFLQGGNRGNYIVGGTIFLFNRLMDDTTDPVKYYGGRNFGNIKQAPSQLQKEDKPHYSASSGAYVEDDNLETILSEEFTVTFDEWCAQAAWNYFRSATLTDVAASSGNARTETVFLVGTDVAWLMEYAPTLVSVK